LSFDISLLIEPSRTVDEKIYVKDGNLTYNIIANADFKTAPSIEQTSPGGIIEIIQSSGSGRNYTASIKVPKGASGKQKAKITSVSVDDLNDSITLEYFIDTIAPSISFVVPGENEIDGNVKLKVKGSDDLHAVKIYFKKADVNAFSILGSMSKDGNFFVIDFNTGDLNEGKYVLKAEAEDFAGNAAELSKEVYLIPFDENRQASKTEVNNALTQKIIIDDILEAFDTQLISFSEEAMKALTDGKAALSEAEKLFNDRNYASAEQKAAEAIALLKEAEKKAGKITVEEIKTFALDETKFNDELNKLGLSDKAKQDIAALKGSAATERKIKVLKIVDSEGNEKYKLNYVVSFKNSSAEELKNVKLLEIIPKAVAGSAKELAFSGKYEIVRDDPVIVWTIESVKPGEELSMSYSYQKDLSKEEIDALVAKEPLKNYSIAPVAALEATDLSALKGGLDLFWISIIGAAIIIVGCIAFGLFYFLPKIKKKKEKEAEIEEKVKKSEPKKPKFAARKK
jgi:hypothetical protein